MTFELFEIFEIFETFETFGNLLIKVYMKLRKTFILKSSQLVPLSAAVSAYSMLVGLEPFLRSMWLRW